MNCSRSNCLTSEISGKRHKKRGGVNRVTVAIIGMEWGWGRGGAVFNVSLSNLQ